MEYLSLSSEYVFIICGEHCTQFLNLNCGVDSKVNYYKCAHVCVCVCVCVCVRENPGMSLFMSFTMSPGNEARGGGEGGSGERGRVSGFPLKCLELQHFPQQGVSLAQNSLNR